MMKEPKPLKEVSEFHELFELPVLNSPKIPNKIRCDLRVNLLQEELNELKCAIDKGDITGVADAFCDLQYVLSGAILEFGLAKKFKELFEEVQRSNMSKACTSLDEAIATQQMYLEKDNTLSYIKEKNELFLVYRKDDCKVLKSINYSPADLKNILKK